MHCWSMHCWYWEFLGSVLDSLIVNGESIGIGIDPKKLVFHVWIEPRMVHESGAPYQMRSDGCDSTVNYVIIKRFLDN